MMNNEPIRTPVGTEHEKTWKRWLRRFRKSLTHNIGWKITSLVLAICLWGGLITQDTSLPRDKVIDGVRITVNNAASLRSNGLVVVDGLDENATAKLRVRVPQRYYNSVTAANYTVRLDLNQIQGTGEQTLKLSASSNNATMYGTVTEIYQPEVTVQVASYATQSRVPVEIQVVGEAPEGYFPAAITYSPQYVDIGGPEETVNAVVRCVATYDQSNVSTSRNPSTVNLDFVFQDAKGNPVDGENLTVTSTGQTAALQRISVSQYVYAMAQVPIDQSSLLKGQVAPGYQVTGIHLTPETITIAGRETAIGPYLTPDAAIYPYEQVDVSNRSQTLTTFLALRTPGSMEYVSNTVVQVNVIIEPIQSADTGDSETE